MTIMQRIRSLLRLKSKGILLGELLVTVGAMTEDDVRAALIEQRRTKMPIGQIAVRAGLVDQDELIRLLELQKLIAEDNRNAALYLVRERADNFAKLLKEAEERTSACEVAMLTR